MDLGSPSGVMRSRVLQTRGLGSSICIVTCWLQPLLKQLVSRYLLTVLKWNRDFVLTYEDFLGEPLKSFIPKKISYPGPLFPDPGLDLRFPGRCMLLLNHCRSRKGLFQRVKDFRQEELRGGRAEGFFGNVGG